jgi:hypothetical protein
MHSQPAEPLERDETGGPGKEKEKNAVRLGL